MGRWLSEVVAPDGSALATDIDTRFLGGLEGPNLEVRRHDVLKDALPEAAFDLIHCRLLLSHFSDRRDAYARIREGLKPDGWFIAEELDFAPVAPCSEGGDAGHHRCSSRRRA